MNGATSVEANGVLRLFMKVGTIAGAAIAVLTLMGIVHGFVMTLIFKPVMAEMVADERRARVAGDSALAAQFQQIERERAALLRAFLAPTTWERDKRLKRLAERWGVD